ncbi:Predicted 3'-5' exonuclease related to the exonuclease domain of PolB [Mycobacteroides abscessus subsp. abscessus]|nr:Predicted 3'-5' exonuclease related to the exonuclease domain of PolB [Mycobacteroides abscessus subsp. abscessus]
MDLLAKYNGRANAPLDQLAKLCGFPGKLGMDGSQVWTRPQYDAEVDLVRTTLEGIDEPHWYQYLDAWPKGKGA